MNSTCISKESLWCLAMCVTVSESRQTASGRTMCKAMRGKPKFSGDPKMLDIPRMWNICQGKQWEVRREVLIEIENRTCQGLLVEKVERSIFQAY